MSFFFRGTQERVRHSRGKHAISVRAIEVLLHMVVVWLALLLTCLSGYTTLYQGLLPWLHNSIVQKSTAERVTDCLNAYGNISIH